MNKLFLILTLLLVSNCFSQDSNKQVYYSDNGIEIYIKPIDCVNPAKGRAIQYLMVEIVNTTNNPVQVSFNKEIWYNNICQTCNSNSTEYNTAVVVNPNSSVQGNCDDTTKDLKIFSKMLNHSKVRKLTKYELKNITVENLK